MSIRAQNCGCAFDRQKTTAQEAAMATMWFPWCSNGRAVQVEGGRGVQGEGACSRATAHNYVGVRQRVHHRLVHVRARGHSCTLLAHGP